MRLALLLPTVLAVLGPSCTRGREQPQASQDSTGPLAHSAIDAAVRPTEADSLQRAGLSFLIGTVADTIWRRDSIEEIAGWMVGDAHAVTWARFHGRQFLTLDTMVARRGQHAIWKVLDAVWIPALPDSLRFVEGCLYEPRLVAGDMPDDGLMGIAPVRDVEWLSGITAAWRADTVAGRFRTVTADNLRCYNKGFGVD